MANHLRITVRVRVSIRARVTGRVEVGVRGKFIFTLTVRVTITKLQFISRFSLCLPVKGQTLSILRKPPPGK